METFLSLQIYIRNINFYFKLSFLCIIRNNLSERVDFNLPFSWDCVKFLGVVVMMCQGMRGGGRGGSEEYGPQVILPHWCLLNHPSSCLQDSFKSRSPLHFSSALLGIRKHVSMSHWGRENFAGLLRHLWWQPTTYSFFSEVLQPSWGSAEDTRIMSFLLPDPQKYLGLCHLPGWANGVVHKN